MSPHRWGQLVLLPRLSADGKRDAPFPALLCPRLHPVAHDRLIEGQSAAFCKACGTAIWFAAGFRTIDGRPFLVEYESSAAELVWMEQQAMDLERTLSYFATHAVRRHAA